MSLLVHFQFTELPDHTVPVIAAFIVVNSWCIEKIAQNRFLYTKICKICMHLSPKNLKYILSKADVFNKWKSPPIVQIHTLIHTDIHTFHGSISLSQRQYNVEQVINIQIHTLYSVK